MLFNVRTFLAVIVGFGLLAYGTYETAETALFVSRAEQVNGQVVRMERNQYWRRGISRTSYSPVIAFRTKVGQPIQFRSPRAYDSAVGATLPVMYVPQQPERARIDTFQTLWLTPVMIMVTGAACLTFGVYMLAYHRVE